MASDRPKQRILVVDDDPLVRKAIAACLKKEGFAVTAADGRESGVLALQSTTYDLMLIDIFMPRMRGFEPIRIFHELAPETPLIAISGYSFAALEVATSDFHQIAFEFGAVRCLRKPFTLEVLLANVRECLAGAPGAVRSSR
jgi:CheY-like chemotaxis protein